MSASQRNKGAGYEREVCADIAASLGIAIKRNISQARDGGNDIDVGPLLIECKRRKTLTTIRKWFDQVRVATVRAVEHAALRGDIEPRYPVIVCREDQGESLVVIRLADFLMLTRDQLRAHALDAKYGV